MMGTLEAKLAEIRAEGAAKFPPEVLATFHRATEKLRASGIMDGIPKVGDPAPPFACPNLDGDTVRLEARLEDGPVLLSFFRGRW